MQYRRREKEREKEKETTTFPIFMNRSLGWFPRTWIVGFFNPGDLSHSRNTYLKFPKGFILLQSQITSPFSANMIVIEIYLYVCLEGMKSQCHL
ncbi:hypothetical protein ALC57_09214 [Trachymyrmex cornetzi]|uniref:Uncharacterized protein n=1 Tax=Trachymyrmex cornetzi TaxID=471704 RepID=A0A195E0Y0_9HYME|nr:hypothetical protein ALC57_09214 [Trachymyrmex cornetzi]